MKAGKTIAWMLQLVLFVFLILSFNVLVFAEQYDFVKQWGTYGSDDGQFDNPSDIEVDKSGNNYVVDMGNRRIQKFNSDGEFLAKWPCTGNNGMGSPYTIAIDNSGQMYVYGVGNLLKFDSDGFLIETWPNILQYISGLLPYIDIDGSDNVYVLGNCGSDDPSINKYCIGRFTSTGDFINKWGVDFTEYDPLPMSIAVNNSGIAYVVDKDIVGEFTPQGSIVVVWNKLNFLELGPFMIIDDIAIDDQGNVYILGKGIGITKTKLIQKYDANRTFITQWEFDSESGSYDRIAVENNGDNVYVAEQNNRVLKFKKSAGGSTSTTTTSIFTTTTTTIGAAGEPYLVKDINPGYKGSISFLPHSELTSVNGKLYFTADDGIHGRELWKSDGTEAGTVMVKDINSSDSRLNNLIDVNGKLYFTADDGIHGKELWKSDGTEAGTVMVKDINPGIIDSTGLLSSFCNFNGTLYFAAYDGIHGEELWKSDGTEIGTVMVKDINQGSERSYPAHFTDVNGTLYFQADDGTHGEELWKSDGTEAGTVMVKDIDPGQGDALADYLTNVNGTLYFTTLWRIWKSDGTEAGTVMVKDFTPDIIGSTSPLSSLCNVNGILYFVASDGIHSYELWKSDGTESGTVMVKDINPGSGSSNPKLLDLLYDTEGTLYFTADDGIHGTELWKSDGTEIGTVMVKDINPNGDGTIFVLYDNLPAIVNGTLYFQADDGIHGTELWKSDGTEIGTVMVKDINPGTELSYPALLTNVNGTLYFSAYDGIHGDELWALTISATGSTTTTTISNGSTTTINSGGTSTTTTIRSGPCPIKKIYGENASEIGLLRKYRDNVLSNTPAGHEIIKKYYKFSPTITKLLEQMPLLKNRAKAFIDSILPVIRKKVEESTNKK